jgi:predicted nucleic acid-binding protein
MNQQSRTERIADELAKRFEDCSSVVHDCLSTVRRKGGYTEAQLRDMALFLRTSAQIAGVIARLEVQASREKAREHENRGSIPQ